MVGILTDVTIIVIPLEVAVVGLAHSELVIIQVITCTSVKLLDVYVELSVPALDPSTCH